MAADPREFVGASWVARRLGLHRTTVQQAALEGRIPAYRVLSDWRFDPDEIEAWLAAHHNQRTMGPGRAVEEPSRPAPDARPRRPEGVALLPATNPPLRVAIFPDAPWREPTDLPMVGNGPARRRARTKRKAASAAN